MPTEAEIIEALRPVEDPELHRSIVDLGMVKEVAEAGGSVRVMIALVMLVPAPYGLGAPLEG